MKDLLPTEKSFKIILIEDKYNSGHWVAVTRLNNTINYFNSYGAAPDTDWKFINRMIRVILGENTNETTRLMKQAKTEGFETEWNQTKYQRVSSAIQTCGRWVILYVEMMKMGYTLGQFKQFVTEQAKKMKKPYDYVVSKYIKQ